LKFTIFAIEDGKTVRSSIHKGGIINAKSLPMGIGS